MEEFPILLEAALLSLQEEMARAYWNKFQKDWDDEFDNPFTNSGNVIGFDNGTFEVHAYDWGNEEQEYNFKCGDIEVRWYKYFGRGMYVNRAVSNDEIEAILNKCLGSLGNGWNSKVNNEKLG